MCGALDVPGIRARVSNVLVVRHVFKTICPSTPAAPRLQPRDEPDVPELFNSWRIEKASDKTLEKTLKKTKLLEIAKNQRDQLTRMCKRAGNIEKQKPCNIG